MKRLFIFLFAVLFSFTAIAQNPIKVKAPNLVGLNEQFNITFEIQGEGKISNFNWNPGSDFQLVWGPQEGSSSSTTIVNGKVNRSVTKSYTYVLIPKAVGHFNLPAATVKIEGKAITSDEPAIEVVAEQSRNQGGQSSQNSSETGNIPDEDLFLRLQFSKTKMLVGEPITATLKLYQRVSIAGIEKGKLPEFNGFWSQEEAPDNIEFQRESLNGVIYQSAVIRTWNLIPQRAGEHEIPGSELVCVVNVRVPRASTGSIFDEFFHDDFRTIRKRVTTPSVKLKVDALPSGAPASFGGGVGNYSMGVKLSKDSLKVHEAASLTITIKGKGNISLLEAPKIKFPTDFESYDVKTSEISGGKTFEYPFIPRSHGEFDLGSIEYSYYDINSASYKTLSSSPISIFVEKGAADQSMSSGSLVSGVQRKDVKDLSSDIRYIFTSAHNLKPSGKFFVSSAVFYIILILFLVLSVVLYFSFKALQKRRSDIVASKNRAAVKMARARLTQSEQFLKKGLYSAFYEELHRALLGYVGDKLNLDSNDMSKDIISQKLREKNVSENLALDFISLLDECEFARYAPSSSNDAMSTHYETAVNVISSIESTMKKNIKKGTGVAALIALLLISPNLFAQESIDVLWQEGIEAYNSGNWDAAIDAWHNIETQGYSDSKLYYNIAGAYFKNDDISKAILYYERALLLNPSDKDAEFNLKLANSMIQDKIEVLPEFFLVTWIKKLSWSLSSNVWAAVSLCFFALALGFCLLFLLSRTSAKRRVGFSLSLVFLVFFISSLLLSISQKNSYQRLDTAIVMRAVCNVKSSPSASTSKDLFVIHEGTKVKLLDNLGAWTNIELSDGRQGWIPSDDIEIISPLAL